MSDLRIEIGVVTDEITRDLGRALEYAREWGISSFELREGSEKRFPAFTSSEIAMIDAAVASGEKITAVSPGIFKQSSADEGETSRQLADTLPRTIELAKRFECPLVIVFGFEKIGEEGPRERLLAMKAFESAAEQAAAAGLTIAIENEPNFWLDGPDDAVAMLREIGHPTIKLNWDPANRIWGGSDVSREDFDTMRPLITNLHVKDYDPSDPKAPWVPVGEGTIDWVSILDWVIEADFLSHITLETHCANGVEASRRSHVKLTELLSR